MSNQDIASATTPTAQLQLAAPAYALLLLLAVIAFWPGYQRALKSEVGFWVHLHAASATLWMMLLIVQPLAIRWRRLGVHRALGRSSLILMPLVVIGFVGLAHSELKGKTGFEFATQAYFDYIRVVLVAIFVGAFILGWRNRHDPSVHARYMICTGLTVIDPIFHRIISWLMNHADFNYQLLTFGLVCVILLALIYAERRSQSGRQVFPIALTAFVVGGIPPALDFHTWGSVWTGWKTIVLAFSRLPLT